MINCSVERMRSYQFSLRYVFFRLYTLFHTFPHSKSTKSNDFTRVYSFAYSRILCSRGVLLYRRRNTTTARSVAQVSLSLLVDYEPSRVGFRLRLSFIYCKCSSLAQPSCTHKSLMASTSILISCLLTTCSLFTPAFHPDIPCRHILSRVTIIMPLSGPGLLRFPPLQGLRSSAFSYVPQK